MPVKREPLGLSLISSHDPPSRVGKIRMETMGRGYKPYGQVDSSSQFV